MTAVNPILTQQDFLADRNHTERKMSDIIGTAFDVTTKAGVEAAGAWLEKVGEIPEEYLNAAAIFAAVAALAGLAYAICSNSTTIKDQKAAANDLIKAAKENGAKSVNIKMDHDAAAELQSSIPETVKMKAERNGKMHVEVVFA
jgi:hypothetical protein